MSYQSPSEFEKIADLEKEQNRIRDILHFRSATSQRRESSITGFGRKGQNLGSHVGGESWFPIERSVTDVDEGGTSTGVFDRLDIHALSMVVTGIPALIPLKFIQHIGDGKIFSLTPKTGKTLQLQPGGNIDITANVDIEDNEACLLQYFADTDTVKCIGAPVDVSQSVPSGSAENDHLEWDNAGMQWVAQQFLELNATGPHPTVGDIRFKNDAINMAFRNNANTGDLEIKYSAADFLDITENNNAIVKFRLRSQHAVDADNTIDILVGSGSGGLLTIQGSKDIGVDIGATSVVLFESSGDINALGNNLERVTDLIMEDSGTPASRIIWDRAEDSDTYFADDGVSADRINVFAGGVAGWAWLNDGTNYIAGIPSGITASILTMSSGHFAGDARTVPADGDIDNDALNYYTDTSSDPPHPAFKRKTTVGVVSTGRFVYSPLDFTFNVNDQSLSNANAYGFADAGGLIQGSTTIPHMNFVLTGASTFRFTTNATNVLDIDDATGLTMLGTHNIALGNNNLTGVNQIAFNEPNMTITDAPTGITISVPDTTDTIDIDVNGRIVSFADGFVDISTNSLDVTERTAPAATANQAKLYAKDVATVTKMFVKWSDGTEIELGAGGGSDTPWTEDHDAAGFSLDNLDDLIFQSDVTDPAGTEAYMNYDGSQVQINFPVGQLFKVRQNNVDVLQSSGTQFRPSTDEGVTLGTASARWSEAHVVEITLKNNGTSVPAAGVHQITADTNGLYIGADDLTDEIRFYLAGQQHMQFRDGAMEFSQEGHEIRWSGASLQLIASLTSDDVEIWTGTGRGFANVDVDNLVVDINTQSTTEASPMELRFVFRHSAPEGLVDPDFGRIKFLGENTANAIHEFALITGGQTVATSASEGGFLQFGAYSDGLARLAITVEGDATANIKLGFYDKGLGSTVAQQTVSGSRGGNVALANLLTALDALGLIVDSTGV